MLRFTKLRILYNVIIVVAVTSTQAAVAANLDVYFGVGLMDFDYAEYDDNNTFLDGETGLIPGILMSIREQQKKFYIEAEGSYYSSNIDYDGFTQPPSSTPVKTVSDADIIDVSLKAGYVTEQAGSWYAGLGYRYWYRHIRSGQDINGQPVAGLLEEYDWFYFLAGLETHFQATANVSVGLDLRLTRMLDASMEIDFLGFQSRDNSRVELGLRTGYRFALPIKIKTRSQSAFLIAPYYEIIDIGKSNSVQVTSGGVPTAIFIHEPRSETRNLGIELTWSW